MQTLLKNIVLVLLFFNGISAAIGGYSLISDPSGQTMHLDTSLLAHSMFSNFLIPGLLLFFVIGLSSLLIAVLLLCRITWTCCLVIAQGIILFGWIVIQIWQIAHFHLLHVIYASTALILIFAGKLLWQLTRQRSFHATS